MTTLLYFLRDLLQIVLAPSKGWEDVSGDGMEVQRLLVKGFMPLIGIASLTVFAKWLYVDDASLIILLEQAFVCFLKYFTTYFVAAFFFTLYLPGCIDGELSVKKCHSYIIYSLGLLVLIDILRNCVPFDMALLSLLPIYAYYAMWRALRYLNISFNGVLKFMALTALTIVLPPILLQYLFEVGGMWQY